MITPPESDAFAAVADIADLASRLGAVALMPLDDPSLWLCDQVASLAGIRVLGPTGDQARLALDKRLQIELAQNAGLQVPPTDVYADSEDLPDVPAFPVVLRPALALYEKNGKLARSDTRVCADADELRAAAGDLGSGRSSCSRSCAARAKVSSGLPSRAPSAIGARTGGCGWSTPRGRGQAHAYRRHRTRT